MASVQFHDAFTFKPVDSPEDGAWRIDGQPVACYLVGPAFFDPQVNGYAGVDFQDPDVSRDAIEFAVTELRRAGCSHILLTLITAPSELLEAQFARLASILEKSALAREAIPGFHLEGPYLTD